MIKVDIHFVNYVIINLIIWNSIVLDTGSTTTNPSTTEPSSDSAKQIFPYVDFSEFNTNVIRAKAAGNLPLNINFFYD